jgi:hypothetical protein
VPVNAYRFCLKKAADAPDSLQRSKLQLDLSAHRVSDREGKNTLHRHSVLVYGIGRVLSAPLCVAISWAQIVHPYNDAKGHDRECWIIWIFGSGYFETTPASISRVTEIAECKRVDRSRVAVQCFATRCEGTLRSAWTSWKTNLQK